MLSLSNTISRRITTVAAAVSSEAYVLRVCNAPSQNQIHHRHRSFSSSSSSEPPPQHLYAAVNHANAYNEAMAGRHGRQLALAYEEGIGKDHRMNPDIDFEEYDDFDDDEEEDEEDEEEVEHDDNDNLEDEEDDSKDDYTPSKYTNDGSLRRPLSLRTSLRAGAPAGGTFAIIQLAGKQYKVTPDDVVVCNKLKPVDKWAVSKTLTLTSEEVLLVASPQKTFVGLPSLEHAEVDVMVEEITKDKKVIVFKKRRRKNSKRKKGFRREVTLLRVLDIRMPGLEDLQKEEDRKESVA